MNPPFEHSAGAVRVFYSKVFFNILLNINAVRMGLYPTLLCNMDGPLEAGLWRAAVPEVMDAMKRMRDGYDGRS